MFQAGTTTNIIPNTATLKGTLRTLKPETREFGRNRIKEIAEHTARAFGAEAKVDLKEGYPATKTEPCAADRFRATAARAFGEDSVTECAPVMGGEDFSFYGDHCPACFYFVGVMPEGMERYPNLHSPEFDFNDDTIPIGMKAMCELALGA